MAAQRRRRKRECMCAQHGHRPRDERHFAVAHAAGPILICRCPRNGCAREPMRFRASLAARACALFAAVPHMAESGVGLLAVHAVKDRYHALDVREDRRDPVVRVGPIHIDRALFA